MGEHICFLITVFYEAAGSTLDCALKIKRESLPDDVTSYPMEHENKKILHDLLPLHVKSAGPIIKVVDLFEVHSA